MENVHACVTAMHTLPQEGHLENVLHGLCQGTHDVNNLPC